MSDLNPGQEAIAGHLDGMTVVDAGPGTGKTHTIVRRYRNILSRPDTDPRDVLLLTFTNNAAAEMRERLESDLGTGIPIQTSTFDSFCLDLVMDSAEAVSNTLGFDGILTRGSSLIQSKTLNREHFRGVFQRFMRNNGGRYGGMAAIASSNVNELFDLIEKMMSKGILPAPDREWIGEGSEIQGRRNELLSRLRGMNDGGLLKKALRGSEDDPPEWYSEDLECIPDEVLEEAVYEDRTQMEGMVHDIYREYLRASIEDNRLTFGIVELFAFAALYGSADVRRRSSFRYVMIDEFQDTNGLQLKIALLVLKEPNLCAVGDWKQGIYGFRNVSVDNMIQFEDKVEEARAELNRGERRIPFKIGKVRRFPLEESYRSTQTVIDAAFKALHLPATNKEEMEDRSSSIVHIRAAREEMAKYTEFETIRTDSLEKEVHAIAQKVQCYVTDPKYRIWEDGVPRRAGYGDIAVLCRKNEMGRMIRDRMISLGIPAFLQGDTEIMRTREAKLALAWLRYVNNDADPRGPVAIMADMGYSMAEMEAAVGRDGSIPEPIIRLRAGLMRKRRRMTSMLSSIFSIYGLDNDITQSIISAISSAHRDSLLTMSDVIRLIENDMERSEAYETDPTLDTEAVTVQTMHKSKGLEYPIVIVAGLNERSFPRQEEAQRGFVLDGLLGMRATHEYVSGRGYHRILPSWRWRILSAAKGSDYDEQRRLLFVAISRAKQYVALTCSRPSPFIKGYGDIMTFMEPTLECIPRPPAGKDAVRPELRTDRRPKAELTVHDLMGKPLDGGGKGPEYGNLVHDAAHLLAMGMEPKGDLEEVPALREILGSVKDADILSEAECTLPLENAVIRGTMDMLAVYPDRVEVHDYKTDMNDDNLQRYRIQLGVYGCIAAAHFKRRAECYIHFVSRSPRHTVRTEPLTPDAVSELARGCSGPI